MKICFTLLLLSFIALKLYSQKPKKIIGANQQKTAVAPAKPTKEETQAWIKEKIENFTHSFTRSYEYGTYKYEVRFWECDIIIIQKESGKHKHAFTGEWGDYFNNYTYEIPFSKLSKISFSKVAENTTNFLLKIKTSENLIRQSFESNIASLNETKKVNMVELYIPTDLLNDNLPERLTKAFNNLIEICGGETVKDIF